MELDPNLASALWGSKAVSVCSSVQHGQSPHLCGGCEHQVSTCSVPAALLEDCLVAGTQPHPHKHRHPGTHAQRDWESADRLASPGHVRDG